MGRLIDEDDVIAEIEHHKQFIMETQKQKYGNTDEIADLYFLAHDHIKEAIKAKVPPAQPEPQWIPCSERLPEKEGWYITTVESEKTGKRRIENDLFAIDIALAHGHTPNKFCKDGYRQRTVAWCEFPEPWRGEEHETD